MKKKSINRKFSNSSLRQSKNKMMGGADAGTSASKKNHFDIPKGTTEITEKSWEEWKVDKRDLSSVTIPDSVKTIKKNAFKSAFYVTPKQLIPRGILTRLIMEKICTQLKRKKYSDITSVIIPHGIVTINPGCFAMCQELKEVILPDSVQFISTGAFAHCVQLKTIVMPEVLVNSRRS